MSIHREILGGVVEQIRQADARAGVVLFGSVAQNQERPGSDLDLLVVQELFREIHYADSRVVHEEHGMHLIRGHVQGVQVDLACWSLGALQGAIREAPYVFYPLSLGIVLRDPQGLADQCLRSLRQYLQASPSTVAAWTQQLEELARYKADASYPLRFRQWGDFVEHLRLVVGSQSPV